MRPTIKRSPGGDLAYPVDDLVMDYLPVQVPSPLAKRSHSASHCGEKRGDSKNAPKRRENIAALVKVEPKCISFIRDDGTEMEFSA
jgi:hypothetical protein